MVDDILKQKPEDQLDELLQKLVWTAIELLEHGHGRMSLETNVDSGDVRNVFLRAGKSWKYRITNKILRYCNDSRHGSDRRNGV